MSKFLDESEFYENLDSEPSVGQKANYENMKEQLDEFSGYSYTNRDGEFIPVSKSHIEHAIQYKIELQKKSPSLRCNWNHHRDMMWHDGFGVDSKGKLTILDSSDTNENYRQMVKRAQKDYGLLPDQKTYVDRLSDTKLKSIEKKIGELYTQRRGIQNERRELNKSKRYIADNLILMDEILEKIESGEYSVLSDNIEIQPDALKSMKDMSDGFMLVLPSDWHIGQSGRDLTLSMMERRIEEYAHKIIIWANQMGINRVFYANLGDVINQHLHRNSGYYNELDLSEQILEAHRIQMTLLNELSDYLNVMHLGTVNGNHDRLESDKKSALYKDGVGNLLTKMADSEINRFGKPTLKSNIGYYHKDHIYIPTDFVDNENRLGGIYLEHGDKANNNNDIPGRMAQIGEPIGIRVMGHNHEFSIKSTKNGRMDVGSGALNGSDDYAESLGLIGYPSQLIVLGIGKQFIPIEIPLRKFF